MERGAHLRGSRWQGGTDEGAQLVKAGSGFLPTISVDERSAETEREEKSDTYGFVTSVQRSANGF